jgi:hypothetical protein
LVGVAVAVGIGVEVAGTVGGTDDSAVEAAEVTSGAEEAAVVFAAVKRSTATDELCDAAGSLCRGSVEGGVIALIVGG